MEKDTKLMQFIYQFCADKDIQPEATIRSECKQFTITVTAKQLPSVVSIADNKVSVNKNLMKQTSQLMLVFNLTIAFCHVLGYTKNTKVLELIDFSRFDYESNIYDHVICAIAKQEGEYIEEWVEHHKKIGFNHFFIYDNNDTNDDLDCIRTREDCTIIECRGQKMQIPAYNHFVKNYKHLATWVSFIDIDEFIVPVKHDSIGDFLAEYGHLDSIAVNWQLFTHNGHLKKPRGNVTSNYTQSAFNKHIKCIFRTNLLEFMPLDHMHIPIRYARLLDGTITHSPFNEKNFNDIIRVNHYFTKSREEFQVKIDRGRADSHSPLTWQIFESHTNIDTTEDIIILDKYYSKIKK